MQVGDLVTHRCRRRLVTGIVIDIDTSTSVTAKPGWEYAIWVYWTTVRARKLRTNKKLHTRASLEVVSSCK